MDVAALIVWFVTVGFGSYMVRRWVSHGGLTRGGATHFPAVRVFSHLGLAVAGLILWIAYVGTGAVVVGWIAVIDLVLVGTLGGLLFRRWTTDGRAAMSGRAEPGVDLAEQHIARLPVVLHGALAAVTFVLALLATLGIGAG